MAYLRSLFILKRRQLVALGHLISLFFVICQGCAQSTAPVNPPEVHIKPGAWKTEAYLPLLKGKRVGLVINHSSIVGQTRLVDTLLALEVDIKVLFTPEHGLRGTADAGAAINDKIDPESGVRIISLYGQKKKPSPEDLSNIEVLVFDMQDVGVRFFTYISTLQYMMEAAGDLKIPVIVLDRPNPNGHYIDGPILDTTNFKSFVGLMPIPVVHGMTIGELAKMCLGEKWIKVDCDLTVIPCQNYTHSMSYDLPVKPSPNLPSLRSILLYPGICFFEGTPLSLGRGTATPFQVVGHPAYPDHTFSFRPTSMPGATDPPLKDMTCYGMDLSRLNVDSLFNNKKLDLTILLHFYDQMDHGTFFNNSWFDKLAGNNSLRKAIEAGWSEEQIRHSWAADLARFNERRKLYLLYKDFE